MKTRTKPIISMLEDIRVYIMKRWATNRSKVKSFKGAVCPRIVDRLKKESSLTRHWIPRYVINIYIYLWQQHNQIGCLHFCCITCRWSAEKLFEVRHASNWPITTTATITANWPIIATSPNTAIRHRKSNRPNTAIWPSSSSINTITTHNSNTTISLFNTNWYCSHSVPTTPRSISTCIKQPICPTNEEQTPG